MKKVKMFVLMLLFLVFAPSQVGAKYSLAAKNIPVNRKNGHLGTRADGLDIVVSLEQNSLVAKVSHYVGEVKVYVHDDNGNIAATTFLFVDGDGQCTLDLHTLDSGPYEVVLEFSSVIYAGIFEL